MLLKPLHLPFGAVDLATISLTISSCLAFVYTTTFPFRKFCQFGRGSPVVPRSETKSPRQAHKMCRIFTFHHLCGHVHSSNTISCPSPVPFTSPRPACHSPLTPHPDTRILSPSPPCAETAYEPHVYPTLCNSCKKIGIISEWFAKEPSARIEAIMGWRQQEGREVVRGKAFSAPRASAAGGMGNESGDSTGEVEEMPFIQPDDARSHSEAGSRSQSRSNSKASTATTVIHLDPCSRSSSPIANTTSNSNSSPPSPSPSPKTPASASASASPISSNHDSPPTTRLPSPSTPQNHSSPTDKVSTLFHRTQLLVNRMALLNQSMKSRLPVPIPSSKLAAAKKIEQGRQEWWR